MTTLPLARNEKIVVQNLNDEVLIYDLKTDRAYTLNETMKIVFQACDGKTSFDESKLKHHLSDDLIHFALARLKENDLLAAPESVTDYFANLSRREVIRKIGLTSLTAIPVILVLVAPTAAHAASSCTPGTLAGGSGRNQACICQAGTPASTQCGTGNGSGGAPNTFCKAGCTCTSLATPTTLCNQGGTCRGTCG